MGRTLRRSKRIGRKPLSTKSMKPLKPQPRVVLQKLDGVGSRASTKKDNKRPSAEEGINRLSTKEGNKLPSTEEDINRPSTKEGINRPSTKEGNKPPINHQIPTPSSWLMPDRVYWSDLQTLCRANNRMDYTIIQLREAVKHLEELHESGTNTTDNKQIKDSITQFHETAKHLEELNKSIGKMMFEFIGKLCEEDWKRKLKLKSLA